MKKINVNKDACIGCGACVAIDPEHFEFNDEGLSHPINNENLESEELANAINSCPTVAITIVDSENEESETSEAHEEECSCCGHCHECETCEED